MASYVLCLLFEQNLNPLYPRMKSLHLIDNNNNLDAMINDNANNTNKLHVQ